MCFSATASFTAGAVITAIGVASELKVRKKSQRLFAAVPLIFGLQQIAEGFVWVSLQRPDQLLMQYISTYVFLITADVLWPVMVAASCLLMEENPGKRKILKILLAAGAALSLYYAFCLLSFAVTPEILNCHINYAGEFPHVLVIPAFLVYLVVTITPFFVSGVKGMPWLGAVLFLACVVSVIFYIQNLTSVWCFFAAILSIFIYLLISREKQKGS
ncbi:MAG TPA: hypothetical protein PLJ84_00780 [Bacteroidales bacterium]|nr:hypothetical protein [Bacteroidales bacterium]HPT01105.1 hypothetical protein [Bacteroidales bacterium]